MLSSNAISVGGNDFSEEGFAVSFVPSVFAIHRECLLWEELAYILPQQAATNLFSFVNIIIYVYLLITYVD